MLNKAYEAQCASMEAHGSDTRQSDRRTLTLLALALGTFYIGTSESASMGTLQLFATSLDLDISTATHAIEAYAFGVVLGGPAVTILGAKLNRKHLLLVLMAIFVLGNVMSAIATGLGMLTLARFVSGVPQGAELLPS
ncbi:MFS transporter [Variovorax sp. J22R24]|uniref:MFS transporter n=1 Tax=Variovorax gracilis TaxID=3053502 RepID=UPI002577E38F|nr:MFS transporter [Variovorax sp. J22R24]MDM0108354.1 MFS transporter [Variovorax sp. J22R24]